MSASNAIQGATRRYAAWAKLTSDHVSPATGKTIAVTISKNGGAFANPHAGATNMTEVSAGYYYVDLDATDHGTLGPLAILGTAAATDQIEIDCHVVVDPIALFWLSPELHDGTCPSAPADSTHIVLDSSASAENDYYNDLQVSIDSGTGAGQTRKIVDYVGSTTKVAEVDRAWEVDPDATSVYTFGGLAPSSSGPSAATIADAVWTEALPGAYSAGSAGYVAGTYLDATVSGRMATYTQPTGFLAATFPSGTVASTTNITGGTITTTTNLTNLPAASTDWLSAAAFSAAAATKVLDAFWARGELNDGTCPSAPADSTHLVLASSASAEDDYYNGLQVSIDSGTGAGQSRRIVDYVGSTTKIAEVDRAWEVDPDATSVYTFGGLAPSSSGPTAEEVADAVADVILADGTLQSGSPTGGVLAAGSPSVSLVGSGITIVSGTGVGGHREILTHNTGTKAFTVAAWATEPDNTSKYAIGPYVPTRSEIGAVVAASPVASVTGTVGGLATDAISAGSVSAAAVTKIQSGLATPTNITAATGIVLSGVTHAGAVVPTVTNLTNAPTAGDLTAAMKASVTAAATAATPVVASVTGGVALSAAGLDAIPVETGINARQALSPILAAASGVLSGATGPTVLLKNPAGTETRVTATTDSHGNRTAITLNLPS